MSNDIKLEAQKYIKNNCKYYKNYFLSRKLNISVNNTVKILEKKLLNINSFCYYIVFSLSELFMDTALYKNLSKRERKQFDFCSKSFAKIYMHVDLIFAEINNIKACISKE